MSLVMTGRVLALAEGASREMGPGNSQDGPRGALATAS